MALKKKAVRAGDDAAGAARQQFIAVLARVISREVGEELRGTQQRKSSKKVKLS